jgi:pimeloyl-ACP methyl ester carboxylesterase
MGKLKLIGIILIVIIVAVIVILLVIRAVNQSIVMKKAEEIVNNGGISELVELNVHGTKQFLFIEGKDQSKPVILFLHGGPGVPFPFGVGARSAFPEITENFVAVYYDQRGSGKSYSKDIPMETMNINQFIEDTDVVVEYLAKRFNTEKVMIAGTSWGTIIGTKYSAQYPEKVSAYIGLSQFVNHKNNQLLAMNWLSNIAKNNKDDKLLKSLESLGQPLLTGEKEEELMKYVREYGGENYSDDKTEKASILGMIKTAAFSPDYSLGDLYKATVSGATFSLFTARDLQKEINEVDLMTEINELKLPVYIFQGTHDKITNYDLTKEYIDNLDAKAGKEFITLEHSAHYPNEEDFEVIFDKLVTISTKVQ